MTAEAAVTIPGLMLVLGAALWALATVGAHIECIDAARVAARAAARGEPPSAVRSAAGRVAPDGATVTVRATGTVVRARVRAEVRPLGDVPIDLPPVVVRGRAVAALEHP